MNKELMNILKNSWVFVDIDGTLAEYRFNNHVSAKDGTNNGQTKEEVENGIFLKSRPLKSVIKILSKCKAKGIYTLGAIAFSQEVDDKRRWLKKHCSKIKFDGYVWCLSASDIKSNFSPSQYTTFLFNHSDFERCEVIEKIEYLKSFAENLHLNEYERYKIVFIDDRLDYIKAAEESGFTGIHISSFIN